MQNLKDFFVVILFGSIFVYLLNNDSGLLSAIFDFIVSFSPLAWFIISVIVFAAFGYCYAMKYMIINDGLSLGFFGVSLMQAK